MLTNTIKTTLLAILSTLAVTTHNSSLAQEQLEIRFSHVDADDSPRGKMARYFQNLIRERIGTDIMFVSIFPEGRIVDDIHVMDAVLDNKVEIAAPPLSIVKQYSKRFQVFNLPFIFSSPSAAEAFLQGDYANRLKKTLNQKGFHSFHYLTGGMGQISSNKKLITPNDMQGLTMRTSRSLIEKSWITDMGATPVELPFTRTSRALRQGRVNAQMNVYSNIYFNRFHQHQDYILESNHTHQGYIVLTSKKFINSLPEDIREKFEQAMNEAIAYGSSLAREQNEQAKQQLLEAGTIITKLTTDERQKWIKAMLPLWKEMENEIGRELIQAAASQR